MQRVVPVLVCLFLLLGGLCTGVCLAQAAANGSTHACCHEKDHCGHPVITVQSHPAIAMVRVAPATVTRLFHSVQLAAKLDVVLPEPYILHSSFRTLILRL